MSAEGGAGIARELHVTDRGPRQHTPVVLIHGFSIDQRMWRDDIEALAQTRRVITYDLRGFGQAPPPDPDRSHPDDLLAVFDALGIDRAIVVGLSLGANIAMNFALTHPERLAGLVLASPGLPGATSAHPRPPEQVAAVARAEGVDAALAFWGRHELFAPTRRVPEASALLDEMLADYSGVHWSGAAVTPPLAPIADQIRAIAVPVLIVNGADELAGYLDLGERVHTEIPGSERVVIPRAGHMVNIDNPAEFQRAVLEFLHRIDAG